MSQAIGKKLVSGGGTLWRGMVKKVAYWGVLAGVVGVSCGSYAQAYDFDSLQSMFGEKVQLHPGFAYQELPETKEVLALPKITEQEIKDFSLPALPPVKRPAENTEALSQAEENFCTLVIPLYVEEVADLNPHCTIITEHMQQALLDSLDYAVLLKALNIYRMKHDLDLDSDFYNTAYTRQATQEFADKYWKAIDNRPLVKPGDFLDIEQGTKCIELNMIIGAYQELSYIGFPLANTNQAIDTFNQRCAGRQVKLRELVKHTIENNNAWSDIDPVIDNALHLTIGGWQPQSYLAPNQGTAEQQKPEITEAQQLLKQLGYYQGQADGVLGQATSEAIKSFEYNLGLKQTGKLTFSNMMRLRLYTVGYSPKYLVK